MRPKNRYGRLRVIGEPFRVQYDRPRKELNVVCECSCGNYCVANCRKLMAGKTKSCGCVRACLSR